MIVGLGERRVASIDDLHRTLTDELVGSTIPLTLIRRAEKLVLQVTPAETRGD
ncbi:MAG: hypothetical protein ABI960_05680 [Candidatus Eisenbacteria bacterium]